MERTAKKLLIIYGILVFAKILLSLLVNRPSVFSDGFFYFKMATSLFNNHNFLVNNFTVTQYPPLYPIIISIANIFKDTFVTYKVAQIINAIISSLIIFPTYYLAKEFIKKNQALLISTVIALSSPFFLISNYVVSENLFYPLFMLNILLIYKAVKTRKTSIYLLAGFVLGLAYISRILAVTVIPVMGIVYLIKRKQISIKQPIYYYLAFLIPILPWLIRNYFVYNSFLSIFTSGYHADIEPLAANYNIVIGSFINWLILYLGYIILASGVLFAILYFYGRKIQNKEFKLLYLISFITLFILLVVSANHSNYVVQASGQPFKYLTGRTVGRYLESAIPLILLLGYITYLKLKINISKKAIIITSLIIAFSAQLAIFPLVPFNNSSLTFLGSLRYFLDFIITGTLNFSSKFYWISFILLIIILFLIPIIISTIYNRNKKTAKNIVLVLLILNTIIASGFTIYTSNQWKQNEQNNIGLWINQQDNNKRVYIDKDNEGKIMKQNSHNLYESLGEGRFSSLITYWVKNEVKIVHVSEINSGYFITTKTLDKPLMFKTSNNINIYDLG